MQFRVHSLPLVEQYEYWCETCKTLNLAFVQLENCPECNTPITERGPTGTLKTKYERIYQRG